MLLVVASVGADAEGRNRLRVARVPSTRAGVTLEEAPPLPFVPEIAHARVTLDAVAVAQRRAPAGRRLRRRPEAFPHPRRHSMSPRRCSGGPPASRARAAGSARGSTRLSHSWSCCAPPAKERPPRRRPTSCSRASSGWSAVSSRPANGRSATRRRARCGSAIAACSTWPRRFARRGSKRPGSLCFRPKPRPRIVSARFVVFVADDLGRPDVLEDHVGRAVGDADGVGVRRLEDADASTAVERHEALHEAHVAPLEAGVELLGDPVELLFGGGRIKGVFDDHVRHGFVLSRLCSRSFSFVLEARAPDHRAQSSITGRRESTGREGGEEPKSRVKSGSLFLLLSSPPCLSLSLSRSLRRDEDRAR